MLVGILSNYGDEDVDLDLLAELYETGLRGRGQLLDDAEFQGQNADRTVPSNDLSALHVVQIPSCDSLFQQPFWGRGRAADVIGPLTGRWPHEPNDHRPRPAVTPIHSTGNYAAFVAIIPGDIVQIENLCANCGTIVDHHLRLFGREGDRKE